MFSNRRLFAPIEFFLQVGTPLAFNAGDSSPSGSFRVHCVGFLAERRRRRFGLNKEKRVWYVFQSTLVRRPVAQVVWVAHS